MKELLLQDIVVKEEEKIGFIFAAPLVVAGVGGIVGSNKKRGKKQEEELKRLIEAQRNIPLKVQTTFLVPLNKINTSSCDELENASSDVDGKLLMSYKLNDEEIKAYQSYKNTIKYALKACAEQSQQISEQKIKDAELQLIALTKEEEAKKKKTLIYAGIGVGVLIIGIVIVKAIRGN
jgi:hypothetical protein